MSEKQENKDIEIQEEFTAKELSVRTEKKSVFLKMLIILFKFFVLLILISLPYVISIRFFVDFFENIRNIIIYNSIGIFLLMFILCIFKKIKWGWFFSVLILCGSFFVIGSVLDDITAKPIIYLYPTEQSEVMVKLGNPQNLTHTYPKYADKWQVIAQPNGDLIDIKTNRSLYALYWEGINHNKPEIKEGFVVKGEDTISFLEEKLALLGLNEREANEFIIYWLPKLESSPYNYIYFKTIAEQDKNMPLYISPKPDTIIRVMMAFKNLNDPIEVTEQILPPTPQRNGFTVVEWGGTDLMGNIVR